MTDIDPRPDLPPLWLGIVVTVVGICVLIAYLLTMRALPERRAPRGAWESITVVDGDTTRRAMTFLAPGVGVYERWHHGQRLDSLPITHSLGDLGRVLCLRLPATSAGCWPLVAFGDSVVVKSGDTLQWSFMKRVR